MHEKIARASEVLVEKIKVQEVAHNAYGAALAALRAAEHTFNSALAAEVEAHEALHSALAERRKARRRP